MIWKRIKNDAKIKDVRKSADAAAKQLSAQKNLVNSTSAWLTQRKDQNGFGTDFEYTLLPRGH